MGSYSRPDFGVFLSEHLDKQPQSTTPNILHPSTSHKGYAETQTNRFPSAGATPVRSAPTEATLVTLAVRGISLTRIERTPLTAGLLSVDITCIESHETLQEIKKHNGV